MSKTKTLAQITLNLTPQLRKKFKLAANDADTDMTKVLIQLIEEWLEERVPTQT